MCVCAVDRGVSDLDGGGGGGDGVWVCAVLVARDSIRGNLEETDVVVVVVADVSECRGRFPTGSCCSRCVGFRFMTTWRNFDQRQV